MAKASDLRTQFQQALNHLEETDHIVDRDLLLQVSDEDAGAFASAGCTGSERVTLQTRRGGLSASVSTASATLLSLSYNGRSLISELGSIVDY